VECVDHVLEDLDLDVDARRFGLLGEADDRVAEHFCAADVQEELREPSWIPVAWRDTRIAHVEIGCVRRENRGKDVTFMLAGISRSSTRCRSTRASPTAPPPVRRSSLRRRSARRLRRSRASKRRTAAE
jgi:hypothetical protein